MARVGTSGNDRLRGGGQDVYGDSDSALNGVSPGNGVGHDKITWGQGFAAFGDAWDLFGGSIGGNDSITFTGRNTSAFSVGFGDADFVTGSTGGNDSLTNSSSGSAHLYGDGEYLISALGGDDTLTNNGLSSTLYGDAYRMGYETGGGSDGGHDVLIAGKSGDILFGDAAYMYGGSTGGLDRITGGPGDDYIAGEAYYMDSSIAGSDDLSGGGGDDYIFGDAEIISISVVGGNDTINGGPGIDNLYGGPGDDTFVYGRKSDFDLIHDFNAYSSTEHDQIDLSAFRLTWAELQANITYSDNDQTEFQFSDTQILVVYHIGQGPLEQTDFIL